MEVYEEYDSLKKLWKYKIKKINDDRNAIVHSGEFRSKPVARNVMKTTHKALQAIMNLYEYKAIIKDIEV